MLALYRKVGETLTSFENWEALCDYLPVTHQINSNNSSRVETNLTNFLKTLPHSKKAYDSLIIFLKTLFEKDGLVFFDANEPNSYIAYAAHNIGKKFSLDEYYHKYYIDTLTKNKYIFVNGLYIEENINSKKTRNGKSQNLLFYMKGVFFHSGNEIAVDLFKRLNHLYFLDNLIATTNASTS